MFDDAVTALEDTRGIEKTQGLTGSFELCSPVRDGLNSNLPDLSLSLREIDPQLSDIHPVGAVALPQHCKLESA